MALFVFESVVYLGILLLISYQDHKHRRIPNKLLLCLLILRVIFLAVSFGLSMESGIRELLFSVIASAIILMVLLLFRPYLKGKTGAGDLKLLLVCGFCLGINRFLLSLLFTTALLVATYVYQVVQKRKITIPFAPFLCCGALIASVVVHIAL